MFQAGSWKHLQTLLNVSRGDQILYVGDHMYSDVLRTKRTLGKLLFYYFLLYFEMEKNNSDWFSWKYDMNKTLNSGMPNCRKWCILAELIVVCTSSVLGVWSKVCERSWIGGHSCFRRKTNHQPVWPHKTFHSEVLHSGFIRTCFGILRCSTESKSQCFFFAELIVAGNIMDSVHLRKCGSYHWWKAKAKKKLFSTCCGI